MRKLFFVLLLTGVNFVHADHATTTFKTGSAGAIITTSGSTLSEGELVAGLGVQYSDFDEISDARLKQLGAANKDVHSTASLLNLSAYFSYGLTEDITLGLSIPYVKRSDISEARNNLGVGEADFAGDSEGLGDLNLFGQYRFYKNSMLDASVILGVKAPTGDTDQRELDGVLFETEQQPGSGSWDPFFGLSLSKNYGKIGLSTSILYAVVTEGEQNTGLGDIFNYNLALSYRIKSVEEGHDHHSHTHGSELIDYVDLIVELNGDYRNNAEINNVVDDHAGGHTLYISPGIKLGVGHSWSLYTSLGIPVINDLNGQQSEPEYRIIGGISKAF